MNRLIVTHGFFVQYSLALFSWPNSF